MNENTELKPFGSKLSCPKCGGTDFSKMFVPAGHTDAPEQLRCMCVTCGAHQFTRCKDYAE